MNSPEISLSWGISSFVERLYGDFVRDPSSVGPEWKRYFEQLKNGEPAGGTAVSTSFEARGMPSREPMDAVGGARKRRES